MVSRYRPGLILILVVALAACGSRPPVPVSDRATSLRYPESAYRTVVRGDTLYSIAWESGRDYRQLAAWNRIAPPYTIFPGQRLRLFPPSGVPAASAPSTPEPPGDVEMAAAPAPRPVQVRPLPPPSATPKPAAKPAPAPATKPPTASAPRASAPEIAASAAGGWGWPVRGKILSSFGPGRNGLDIGGNRGQAVLAAASGRVVYEGSGLRGYGQLIIIKHNDEFLSAYAHNDRILVKEGSVVKRGQKIAEMGSTGSDEVKLHFEIRKNGTPVDPMKYLPK